MGLSNSSLQAGGAGAMQGYGQQGQLLNTQHQQQMEAWRAGQGSLGSLMGGLGSIVGMLPFASSKEIKTDKEKIPEGKSLGALRKMPVEAWTYKGGQGDGKRHIGPYAEDFARATGHGDGKSIGAISAIGVAMGAIKDLDAKVSRLADKRKGA